MKSRILALAVLFSSLSGFSMDSAIDPKQIVTDTTLTYAIVIEYKFKNGKKSDKGTEIAKYGFDKRNNLVENHDKKGLYLRYAFDSLNNVYEEYFYEKYDSITGFRIPSSKWIHEYTNGVISKTLRYYINNSQWVLEETIRRQYVLNTQNQIIEDSLFDNSNKLKQTVKSEYLTDAIFEKYPFDFNRIGTLTKHFCTKEIRYSDAGEVKDSTRYIYDQFKRLSKKFEYNLNQSNATVITYKYDEKDRLIEQSQYFGDTDDLFYTIKFEYDKNGLRLNETWLDSNHIPSWTREFRY